MSFIHIFNRFKFGGIVPDTHPKYNFGLSLCNAESNSHSHYTLATWPQISGRRSAYYKCANQRSGLKFGQGSIQIHIYCYILPEQYPIQVLDNLTPDPYWVDSLLNYKHLKGSGLKFYQTNILLPKRQFLKLDKTKYYPQSKQTPWTCPDHSSGFGLQPQIVHSV